MTAVEQARTVELTRQQRAVIGELARDGAGNAEIARRLCITEWTVKCHLKAAQKAMGCTNRTQMAVALLRGQVKVRTVTRRSQEATA